MWVRMLKPNAMEPNHRPERYSIDGNSNESKARPNALEGLAENDIPSIRATGIVRNEILKALNDAMRRTLENRKMNYFDIRNADEAEALREAATAVESDESLHGRTRGAAGRIADESGSILDGLDASRKSLEALREKRKARRRGDRETTVETPSKPPFRTLLTDGGTRPSSSSQKGRPHDNAPDCPRCDSDVFVTGTRGGYQKSRRFAPKWKCQLCGEMWGVRE